LIKLQGRLFYEHLGHACICEHYYAIDALCGIKAANINANKGGMHSYDKKGMIIKVTEDKTHKDDTLRYCRPSVNAALY